MPPPSEGCPPVSVQPFFSLLSDFLGAVMNGKDHLVYQCPEFIWVIRDGFIILPKKRTDFSFVQGE